MKLFSLVTSSASSERNFSTMGYIHNKLRNSLSASTVQKLVYVKTNLPVFYAYENVEIASGNKESYLDEIHENIIDSSDAEKSSTET
mmetsp:Transcript_18749/g.18853  ORF Transcript_18749/g.18853 Transcript_18749/m.18853 type:complete len:87 (+) Transcript_18749:543-803(+)